MISYDGLWRNLHHVANKRCQMSHFVPNLHHWTISAIFCLVLSENTWSRQCSEAFHKLLDGKVEVVNFAKQSSCCWDASISGAAKAWLVKQAERERESLKPSRAFFFWWWKGSGALRVEERRQHERWFQVLFDHSELQLWNWPSASPTRCVGTRHTRKIASQWEMSAELRLVGAASIWNLESACSDCFWRERLKVLISNFLDDTLCWKTLFSWYAIARNPPLSSPQCFSAGLHCPHRLILNPSVTQDLSLRLWTSLHGTSLPMAAGTSSAREGLEMWGYRVF